MNMPEIRKILLADTQLMSLVTAIVPKPSSLLTNIIMYEETITGDDGVVQLARIQLTVVCDTEEQYGQIYDRISEKLLTPDDRPLTNRIRKVEFNGGGSMFDAARSKYHKIMYLNIKARSRKHL